MTVVKDVTVVVPSARSAVRDLDSLKAHSPFEYIQELERRISELMLAAEQDKIALDTFTTIVAAFVKLAADKNLEVLIDRKVIDRMDGSKVTVSEASGTRDVIVRIREGAPHPVWEGRHG